MNEYLISINYSGYIRTNNSSGNAVFQEEFNIEANSLDEAKAMANEMSLGCCKETFQSAKFDIDLNYDEIIRNDTYRTIDVELLHSELSFDKLECFFNENYFDLFTLDISDQDKKDITKKLFERYDNYVFIIESLNDDIWNFIDEKYFLGNIRLNIKELNLNQIRPQTYFHKNLTNDVIINEEKYKTKELIIFLNKIISNDFIDLNNDLDR